MKGQEKQRGCWEYARQFRQVHWSFFLLYILLFGRLLFGIGEGIMASLLGSSVSGRSTSSCRYGTSVVAITTIIVVIIIVIADLVGGMLRQEVGGSGDAAGPWR